MKAIPILVAVVGGIILLVAIVLIIGAALPARHEVSRSVVLRASPEEVYRIVANVENAPTWRRDLKRVELLPDVNGHRFFREHGSNGALTYEVMEAQPGRTLVTRIADLDLGYSGSWTYAFAPHPSGTQLTITERGEVSNLLFRFLSRFVFGHATTIETYIKALSARMEGS
ncbi:MAG TPA: SRPBCC family protein [Thermoanaerobaculia bacterium]|jgi:uncharacterized protein YndB with AHSA1/START domain|nr:SRPBCC family protein [Thermoanaerobaculia bacterium]